MDDRPKPLTIYLFGTPEARITETPLVLHDQKARALLYYLAASGRTHVRDHLATLLWSESPESNARHSLRSSLYHIRQALQTHGCAEALLVEGDLVSLKTDYVVCDVVNFRHLLASASTDQDPGRGTIYGSVGGRGGGL